MIRFLSRDVTGHRVKAGVAIGVISLAVAGDVLTASPLKPILEKIISHSDPTLPASCAVIRVFGRFGDRGDATACVAAGPPTGPHPEESDGG